MTTDGRKDAARRSGGNREAHGGPNAGAAEVAAAAPPAATAQGTTSCSAFKVRSDHQRQQPQQRAGHNHHHHHHHHHRNYYQGQLWHHSHYHNQQPHRSRNAAGGGGGGNTSNSRYYHLNNGGYGGVPPKPRRSARLAGRRAPPPHAPDPRSRNGCPMMRRNRPLIAMTVNILATYRRVNDAYYAMMCAIADSLPVAKPKAPPPQPSRLQSEYTIREGDQIDEGGRYRVVRAVGQGSFGKVVEAVDATTGETVAIKILPKNRESFLKQGRIEIQILEFLKGKDPHDSFNTVRLKRHFEHGGHLCLVFEFLSIHLYEVLRSVKLVGLSLNLIRKFAWQILTALRFLCRPDVQVLHCDLKPENILLAESRKGKIKVIDFGSSCLRNEKKIHKYIQSRFYRAPEVLLGAHLSFGIDMWSLGCILVELFTGEPLFAGKNEHDQMCRMCDVLGQPPAHIIESGDPEKVVQFFTLDADNSHRIIPTRLYEPRGKSLADIVLAKVEEAVNQPRTYAAATAAAAPKATREYGELFRDLVARMLVYDPEQRITPSDALRHRFFPPMASTAVNTALTGDRPRGRSAEVKQQRGCDGTRQTGPGGKAGGMAG